MEYRDDRDALRHRADALERDLRETEARLREAEKKAAAHEQKDVEDEKNIAALRAEVEHLRGRLGIPTHHAPSEMKLPLLLAGALSAMTAMGAGIWAVTRSALTEPERIGTLPTPAPTAPPAPTAGVPLAATDLALFGAEVIEEQGGRVAVGAGCLLRAALGTNQSVVNLNVQCGDKVVHSSTDERGSGINMRDSVVREFAAGPEGAFVYFLRYVDRGEHSGVRSEIDVDTQSHRARVYRQGAEAWSVQLHVGDISFPRWGKALQSASTAKPEFARSLRTIATVTEKGGALEPALANASRCELALHPMVVQPGGPAHNCRILLRCGPTIVYGAGSSGYNQCTVENGAAVAAQDSQRTAEDTDPAMKLSWPERRVEIVDGPPGSEWKMVFRLEEPPRCGFEGSFAGVTVDAAGTHGQVAFVSSAQSIDITRRVKTNETRHSVNTPHCDTGLVLLEADEQHYELELGPGWRSLGGRHVESGTVLAATRR